MVDLTLLHPELVTRLNVVLTSMRAQGLPMQPYQGLRTAEQQHMLWLEGRDGKTLERIVTNCDGYKNKSNHQGRPPDGKGWAVDCLFEGSDPFLEHDPHATVKWATYGHLGESLGLVWGGRFSSPVDLDHLELPADWQTQAQS